MEGGAAGGRGGGAASPAAPGKGIAARLGVRADSARDESAGGATAAAAFLSALQVRESYAIHALFLTQTCPLLT